MITVHLILLILALVCLFLAAINYQPQRVHLGWLGLFLWVLGAALK